MDNCRETEMATMQDSHWKSLQCTGEQKMNTTGQTFTLTV